MMTPCLLTVALVLICSSTVLGDGCHTPVQDIGDEAGLARDICSINSALGRSPPDYVTARAFYRRGYDSRDIKLQEIANGDGNEGVHVEIFSKLFGDEAWLAKLIEDALEGEGDFDDDTKRVQIIKKSLQSAVLGHRMLSNLNKSTEAAEEEDGDAALTYLERALANFFGLDSECAIYGNGQARGIEFGTMNKGVAKTNHDIVEAFGAGAKGIESDPIDVDELSDAVDEIFKNFVTIYLQAVAKYADRIIEGDDPAKAQAEGYGYYHSIAGFVHASDEKAHEAIIAAFDLSGKPDKEKAEKVKDLIPDLLKAFLISDEAFGEFDATRAEDYETPEVEECEGLNPFVDAVTVFVDSDR